MTVSADEGVRESRDSDAKQDAEKCDVHYAPYDAGLHRPPGPRLGLPDWHVDLTESELSPTSTAGERESMPAVVD